MSVLLPGREPVYLRRDLAGTGIGMERPFLQVEDGMISETAQAIRFDISFPGSDYFRGEITKLVPPVVIQDGVLYEDPGTGRTSHWVVQVPYATFTGILQLDGVIRRLCGTAYQDHQWGTILIQEFVSDWVWGHFSDGERAVVFFDLLAKSGGKISRSAIITRSSRYMSTAIKLSHLDTFMQASPEDTPETLATVGFCDAQAHLSFELMSDRMMRNRKGERYHGLEGNYYRWASNATFYQCEIETRLNGITEYQ